MHGVYPQKADLSGSISLKIQTPSWPGYWRVATETCQKPNAALAFAMID
jgi:hypothetical protein